MPFSVYFNIFYTNTVVNYNFTKRGPEKCKAQNNYCVPLYTKKLFLFFLLLV